MCLGIPGQLREISEDNPHLARVDVSGVSRIVNVALLEDEPLNPGDWVLIHVGFALAKIDEEEAALTLVSLRLAAEASSEDLGALSETRMPTGSSDSGGT